MYFDAPPPDRHAAVSTVAMPRDTNALGDIFGGWLMSHADIAGAILAYRRARGRVVTVAVDSFAFLSPVFVGDLVSFYADIGRVGNTSLAVDVSMFAESDWGGEDIRRVATATMVYVHVDDRRRPVAVPGSRQPPRASSSRRRPKA